MKIKITIPNISELVNEKINMHVANLKDNTPVDTGKAKAGWYYKNGAIQNDVDYIDKLNAGSSKQAPAYFVEKTLLQHGAIPNGTIVESK